MRHTPFKITNSCFDGDHFVEIYMEYPYSKFDGINGVDVSFSVRSKTTGAWIVRQAGYITVEVCGEIDFEVPTRIGEVLEVYAHFHHPQMIVCVLEIHRNGDGEVHFFPSTRGWIPAINQRGHSHLRRYLPILSSFSLHSVLNFFTGLVWR